MTREQASLILKHLDIVKHFAEGGEVDFKSYNYKGEYLGLNPVTKGIIINCLPRYVKSKRASVNKKHYCSRWCPLKKKGVNYES